MYSRFLITRFDFLKKEVNILMCVYKIFVFYHQLAFDEF